MRHAASCCRCPRATRLARARVLVPESDGAMLSAGESNGSPIIVTERAIYLREIVGGPSRVEIYGHDGKRQGVLPLPDVASVDEVVALGDGTLLYDIETYLRPPDTSPAITRPAARPRRPRLAQTSPVNFADTEVVRAFATSKDGTRVPLNIVRRKGTVLNGANPMLSTDTAATTTTRPPISLDRRRACGSMPAASTCSPIFAAAANLARTGIARAR